MCQSVFQRGMENYSKTVIVVGDLKQSLLYFDHVIPVNLALEVLKLSDLKALELKFVMPPKSALRFPVALCREPNFNEQYTELVKASTMFFFLYLQKRYRLKKPKWMTNDDVKLGKNYGDEFMKFVKAFGLGSLPIDTTGIPIDSLISNRREAGEVALSLSALDLIDTGALSYEALAELRRDKESIEKLRRLRLFVNDNYQGKSKEYVEDSILSKLSDYNETVRSWGFETKQGAITFLLNSKLIAGGFTGSLISTLFGFPTMAIASSLGAVGLELAKLSLTLSKRKFELRKVMCENPVSYIVDVKAKIESLQMKSG